MSESSNHVCRLTPDGRGALATIGVRGPQAIALVDSFLIPAARRALSDVPVGRILFGHWGHARGEEVVVAVRDVRNVEIHCHGGPVAVAMIMEQLQAAGGLRVAWRDWGTTTDEDPIAAAARHAMADAVTERTALILLDQAQGALRREIERICGQLRQQEQRVAIEGLAALLTRGAIGLHLATPWRVVVTGATNVGKSSLINAILGYERTIVFDRPGTTRDAVSVTTALDGWPVEFTDTAGLRTTTDPIETAGIEAARHAVAGADLTILVFDGTLPWTTDTDQSVKTWPDALIVLNKSDMPRACEGAPATALPTSALSGAGIDGLVAQVVNRLITSNIEPRMPVPFTEVQLAAFRAARDAASRGDPSLAADALSRLVE